MTFDLYEEARAKRRGIDVDRATFEAALSARANEAKAAAELCTADLLLALACAAGDAAGIAAFEAECVPDAARALGRLRIDDAAREEILQRARAKALVAEAGAPPRIATYAARGPLVGWFRALVVHEALSVRRAEVRRGAHDGPSALDRLSRAAPALDADLERMRALYAAPFKAAFAEVLAELGPRDRNVLRLVYVDGLTAEQVAATYGVHRVSVARWLGQIREALFVRTRALLVERLRLSPTELDSVTRLCLSDIDVSLDRLLER